MDTTERAHIENLLKIDRAHLRELEMQQAKLGILAPSGVAVQIEEYRKKIDELDRRLNEAMPRHNLPPRDYERFVGRQQELEDVRRLLLPYPKSRHHLVTIDGIGGIGKSALAMETAYQARERYASLPEAERFEAIVWVSAKRTYLTADGILEHRQSFRTLDDLYAAIAQVLEFPAITRAPAVEQRAIVEQVLAEQRTLLILDNLETVDDEELLVFLRLLPDPTKAIVTTRHRIDVAYPVRLLGMPHDDALGLITLEAARKDVTLADDAPEQLFARTGGLPLAIVWSIGLMGLGGSVESVLRRLSQGQSDIARFCFAESAAQIRGRDAHKLLLALGLFAADAGREVLGVVSGLGEDEFGRDMGLEELLRLSLVNKEGDRFSLLPLTRSFVQAEATKQVKWMHDAKARWLTHLYSLARYGGRSQNWQGYDILARELPNILGAMPGLVSELQYKQNDAGDLVIDDACVAQAKRLASFLAVVARRCRFQGYWRESEILCQQSITIGSSIEDTSSDISEVGFRHLDLSLISDYRGDLESSKLQAIRALKIGNEKASIRLICLSKLHLSRMALHVNDYEEAASLLTSAIADYQQLPKADQMSLFLGGMGELAERQQDLPTALDWYRQAVAIDRRDNIQPYLASHLSDLGRVLLAAGDTTEARACYEESLNIARECGRVDVAAKATYGLACMQYNQQQAEPALASARQALDLFRRLGMKREQAEATALLERLGAEA